MKIKDLSKDGTVLEVEKYKMFNCVSIALRERGQEWQSIFLGKAEVQQLINQLEELKKEIL